MRNGAERGCQSIRGSAIDQAISALLLETVNPAAVAACLAVQEAIARRVEAAETLRTAQLERARHEAELARRRYLKVDPDHRLVADFRRVWDDPKTNALERKRMVALLIEDDIAVQVRFRGGNTTSLRVSRPIPIARIRKTRPEVVQTLDGLLDNLTDREAAVQLNARGFCNWKGEPFTTKKVILVRQAYHLKSRFQRLRAQSYVTGSELAAQLGVSTMTIHQWGRNGLLKRALYGNNKRCLYLPLPPSVTVIKGKATRGHSIPAQLSIAPSTAQEIA